jgi:signal transduction histidine kinase
MARILLIDDSTETEALVEGLLKGSGHRLSSARDARQGIEMARGSLPDLILMDLSLPKIPAWEAIRRIKGDAGLRSIPVVAMSGAAMGAERERALAAGCDGFIAKPISAEGIARALRRHVPAAAPTEDELTRPLAMRTAARGSWARSALLLLSADAEFAAVFGSAFRLRHYALRTAISCAQGLASMEESPPDLVLVDAELEDGDGVGAIPRIRARSRRRFVPILYVARDPGSGARAYRAGADDFVVRPVQEVALRARVHALLLLARTLRLERQHARELGAVARQMREGVALFDESGRLTLMNPRFADLLGVPLKGMLGRSSRHLFRTARLLGDGERPVDPSDNPVLRLARSERRFSVEHLRRADPASSPRLEATFSTLLGGRGQVHGYSMFLRSAGGEGGEAQKEIVEAYERLMEVDQLKSKFLSTVSHELRTPLNTIILLSHLLTTEPPDARPPERRTHDLRVIRQSASTLLHMINNLLDLARLQAGQSAVSRDTFSLPGLLEETIEILAPQAEGRKVRLELRIAPAAPELVVLDREKLRQILINLLSNAIKFSPGEAVCVEADVSGTGASIKLRVRDTGIGIPPEKLPLVFEPFRQIAPRSGSSSGSGLGLSIVKELVHLLGGDITVTSASGSGTTFDVTVPYVAPREDAFDSTRPHPPRPTRELRVLIVEDDESSRYGLRSLLEMEGYRADEAADAAQARERLRARRYDAVFMDVSLPDAEGTALISEIRADPATRSLPVLALTGKTADEDRRAIEAAGATAYLSKPVNVKAMLRALQAATQAPR